MTVWRKETREPCAAERIPEGLANALRPVLNAFDDHFAGEIIVTPGAGLVVEW